MAFPVFAAVLLAAFLHASWNVLVKINHDRFLALFVIHGLMGLVGVAGLIFTGIPIAAAWPFALLSGLLHTAYNMLLARSYRSGEMSVVYPLARGAAPIVSLTLSLAFAGDAVTPGEFAAIAILIAGLWLVAFSRASLATDGRTIAFALATAVFIGCYTVVDGMGARKAGDALAYTAIVYLLDGLFIFVAGLAMRGSAIITQARPIFWRGALGTCFSSVSYGLVIWAMTQAKIGPVAALRETSILFVLVMSQLMLAEKLTALRIAGGLLIVLGAIVLRFA